MIPKVAINEYLDRERDDHRWMKELEEDEVDHALRRVGIKPFPESRIHQKVGNLLGVTYPQFAFFYDMGCVDAETEYLSPEGWKQIGSYTEGMVAQYDPLTGGATFVEPEEYVVKPCSEMIHFRSERGCDQLLSPEHRMLMVAKKLTSDGRRKRNRFGGPPAWKSNPICPLPRTSSDNWFYETTAEEMLDAGNKKAQFETTFLMVGPGINLTDEQLRVQVAVHADGHLVNKTRVVVSVKKTRKRERMHQLLTEAGIEYKATVRSDDFELFRFTPPLHTKTYGPEWYNCSIHQKEVICSEVKHWDGTGRKSGSITFFSRSKPCVDFIQFCFSSTGRRASVHGFGLDWVAHAIGHGRTTNLADLRNGKRVPSPDGKKYCFKVPTSYLVLRRNGNIFVTGNTGKTLMTLDILRFWLEVGRLRRAIILLTSDKAMSTWTRQQLKFGFDDIPYKCLTGSSEEKMDLSRDIKEGLLYVSYPGAVNMLAHKVKGEKWALSGKKVDDFTHGVDALVMDESTRAGHHTSLTHLMCKYIADNKTKFCYGLAGRPFGRDPHLLHGQMDVIDGGQTFGRLGLFREVFFSATSNHFAKKRGGHRGKYVKEFRFRRRSLPDLRRVMQHRSLQYSADECIQLPPVNRYIEPIDLPPEAIPYYEAEAQRLLANRGDVRVVQSAFLRMRQISSGFLGFIDDTNDERIEIEFTENPKEDMLFDFLEELPEDRKALVFYQFTRSGRKISERLKKQKMNHIWLWSGTKNSADEIERFINNKDCYIGVINNQIGSYSLDGLQVANYQFFYESPVGVIDREQAERRVERDGQMFKIFRYDLVMRDTMDERILDFHAEGRDIHQVLKQNPTSLLRS